MDMLGLSPEPHLPEYQYLSSLQDEDKDKAYTLGSSGADTYRNSHTRLQAASMLRNMESLKSASHRPVGVPSQVTSIRSGEQLVEEFFLVLGSRAEQTDVKRTKLLRMEGLATESFLLPGEMIKSAYLGVETQSKITLALLWMDESALWVLGRIIQWARNLNPREHVVCCRGGGAFFVEKKG
jgi:hypothetical protein